MQMPGRNGSSGEYTYGFNGMEKDDEMHDQSGSSYDFGARMYDSRIGRWLAVDPLTGEFPNQGSYNAFNNNPIVFVDPSGKSGVAYWDVLAKTLTLIIKADYHYIEGQFDEDVIAAVHKESNRTYYGINHSERGEINVKFEINFIPHAKGTDLSQYDGTDGQNSLISGDVLIKDAYEESSFKNIMVDQTRIDNASMDNKGATYPVSEEGKKTLEVTSIFHGIGHNIGLIHDDKGLMENVGLILYTEPDLMDRSKESNRVEATQNKLTTDNVQKLIYRMTHMNDRSYWENATEIDEITGKEVSLKDTGVTTYKN